MQQALQEARLASEASNSEALSSLSEATSNLEQVNKAQRCRMPPWLCN